MSPTARQDSAPVTVLALTRYGRLGASSRLRMMQYAPALRENGIELIVAPFFDDAYLTGLYSQQSSVGGTFRAFARRLRALTGRQKIDLLWIEKEALPWLPWAGEHFLLPTGIPIVSDYDDAVFHNYDLHRSSLIRRLLGQKIDRLMAASTIVLAGNGYLADRAGTAGAPWVEVVPTVVDCDAYTVAEDHAPDRPKRIGWIGTSSTWHAYVEPIMPMLTEAAAAFDARITAVGAGRPATQSPLLDNLPWSEDTEVALIQQMDIGLMPLDDSPWARGKCGYKLIQYMACGLPVIATPVGVNAEIVEHGVNGFLAETPADWRKALETLLSDPGLRARMGRAGRARVVRDYSLRAWGPRVAALLRDAAKGTKQA